MSSHYASSHYGPSHYESSHFGREVVIDLPVHPPGMGSARRKRILEEEELIMTIIVAFLEMKGH